MWMSIDSLATCCSIVEDYTRLKPCFEWGQSIDTLFVRVKFTTKIDVPSALRNLQSIRVRMREDLFSISVIELRGKKFIHWLLEVNYFYHTLPGLSEWRKSSQGTVELELAKAIRIVWRNIHHEATKIWPNQYLWLEIMHKYRDDFDGDFEMSIFQKADQRMEEEEDKLNEKRQKKYEDREKKKEISEEMRLLHSKIKARNRVGFG